MDEYAREFFTALPSKQRTIYETVKGFEESTIGHGAHYIRTMEKILNGSVDYVDNELKRCVIRLFELFIIYETDPLLSFQFEQAS